MLVKERVKKFVKKGLQTYNDSLRKAGLKPKSLIEHNKLFWPDIDETDVEAVLKVLSSGEISIITEAGIIDEMRNTFKQFFNVEYVVPQNSGTATLHSAYFALGLKQGDEVIVPSATFHASASPIYLTGAKPVFCEINPNTLTLCPKDLENKITQNTKAVCVVHWYGIPADMDKITEICANHHLALIEDCSQAHGASINNKQVGTIGQIGCYSLQKQKGIAAGEAGILLTNNPDYYDRSLLLGHFGQVSQRGATGKYKDITISGAGYKYRIHPLAAALAVTQLKKLPSKLAQMRRYVTLLEGALEKIEGVGVVKPLENAKRGAYEWGCAISIEQLGKTNEFNLKKFFYNVNADGVGIQKPTPMLHLDRRFRDMIDFSKQPPYPEKRTYKKGDLPITESLYPTLAILQQHVDKIEEAVSRTYEVLKREIAKL